MQLTVTLWEAGLGIAGISILLIGVAYLRKRMRLRKRTDTVNLSYIPPQKVKGEAFVNLFEAESEKALRRIQATVESEKVQLLKFIETPPMEFGTGPAAGDQRAQTCGSYDMARQYAGSGMAFNEISTTLNIPLAEVELAIKVNPAL